MTADFYNFSMRDLGITNKNDIFYPDRISQNMPPYLKTGDLVQIYYNNNRVPDHTVYVWSGTSLEYINRRWDILSVYDVGPAYFSEYTHQLPNLNATFKEDDDGYLRSSVSLAGREYTIEYIHKGTRDWAIDEGYIKPRYHYCPERDIILAH
jgi:hypothetical protein